ncbi:hypothetical protein KGG70_gp26 [Streptomyces phage Celia]|uniref:Uncharacterized protein n=1 Tax=Streptomyces phage Celia TaxID=2590946 RepID=A0A516KRD7_9CAUD|nr:hypothetical protein KGG70_gp26 [Streptomyces phage Celia]QDP44258.1 hypothetical protein SEA_CELIA_55 [Streptomyces phage Celia]QFG10519.1 hypothetical protein SEA_URZA_56 [Streptomyces phage Urza]QJD50622.1 hypothetical protein SEA_ITZA_57 [Streptomyces phage Itza]USH45892.1 hypothetical protein SEA_VIEENROSE_57 [Streptomyces phage VieEnRose]
MKTVRHTSCRCGVKRGFMTEREADKALGRAQAKRSRTAASQGSGRGIRTEHRYYECDFGLFHLTAQNRSDYEGRIAA